TASDACDPAPVVSFAETRTDGACAGSYTLTRTWTATDACGNASTATQTIAVEDTGAPSIADVPADVTVECDAVPAPASPTATDNGDGQPAGSAEVHAQRYDVSAGTCVLVDDVFRVGCDELVDLRLVPAPCPARPPRRPSSPASPGAPQIIEGQKITLRVSAA